MKKYIIIIILVMFSCKKEDRYEKKVRNVVVEYSENVKLKFPQGNYTNCLTKGSTSYLVKEGTGFSFEAIVCNTQTVTIRVKCAGKTLYDNDAKIHSVSVSIP